MNFMYSAPAVLLTALLLHAQTPADKHKRGGGRPSAMLRDLGAPVVLADPTMTNEEGGEEPREAILSGRLGAVPVAPCRVADTRQGEGKTGIFGPPTPSAGTFRAIPIPLSHCGIPLGAAAYSLNITAIPREPLAFLTIYPAGQPRPNVSTLNSFDASIVANAAIVPAGAGGAVEVYVSGRTDFIIDVNGYFTEASQGFPFYILPPCRLVDTRFGEGLFGPFGPPALGSGVTREVPLPAGRCGIPARATAYWLNITVVPRGKLSFLTVWPAGTGRPGVSTLNSLQGRIVANAALVAAGTNGAVNLFVTDTADVIVDISGYLAP